MYTEGKARIKYTKDAFLNADALLSRDISVCFASTFSDKNSKIIDTTAATGIRGIRYYLDAGFRDVTLLDMNKSAYSSMKKNVAFNRVKAKTIHTSIQEYANSAEDKFDFIDLDPFGGITPYIYDLMKISHGDTYLMATATDTAVLCGADYRACVKLYDAKPMHNELCHEVGLRILIGYIARIASQFNFGIDVQLSFSYLHYMRVFLQLRHGSKEAYDSVKKLGYAHYCNKCLYRSIERSILPTKGRCELCGNAVETSGKMWTAGLYGKDHIESMIAHMEKGSAKGIYNRKSLEFLKGTSKEVDSPLYYSIPRITKKLGIGSVSENYVLDRLAEKGFASSKTHMEKNAIKTNATILDIKKCISGSEKARRKRT